MGDPKEEETKKERKGRALGPQEMMKPTKAFTGNEKKYRGTGTGTWLELYRRYRYRYFSDPLPAVPVPVLYPVLFIE